MPAIKKRIKAEYLEREQQRNEQNGRTAAEGDEENLPAAPTVPTVVARPPLKRKAPTGLQMLKGLDGEVLVEKRKRHLPPAEQKLETWLDTNLEKKSESTLSMMKLYQFYTNMCQQDATYVVEMDVFRHMLHNKFGKEFGLKEDSAYTGLLKESKPRKKPVVAPSLGYKMKDLIQEALKASGNPSKGMMFAWVKKFIAAKYPALQIELRPHFLRKALEREIYSGKVELVKGIGFCGFYRLPGPPDVEEESSKSKKKGAKKEKTGKGEESAESADDTVDKEGEESDKSQEKTDESSDKKADDKKKKKSDAEGSAEETEKGKEEEKGEEKKEKKKEKKKRKKPSKPKRRNGPRYGSPQTINDVFPLAMTYMAEPKEASFTRIRKYLEKHYGKVDIDMKLKKCMEHGCETGMWDRVSGSGASGSFQLQVDSFNPEHTESLTDMVCSAIIACTEPKISSVRLLKSYISEYHPEFNIDTRPIKLRNALERAEKQNQLRRISGIGMSGSFQLVESFTPSPAILAGDEEEEEEDDYYAADTGKEEVYVVRKTKSGRRAPLEKTQVDFSSTYKKRVPSSSSGGRAKSSSSSKRKPAAKKSKYVDESFDEEESSEEEEEEKEEAGYKPRPTKSRGGPAPAPKKTVAKAAHARATPAKATLAKSTPATNKSPASKIKGRSKGRSTPSSKRETTAASPKKAKPAPARQARKQPVKEVSGDEEEEEEEEDAYIPQPPKPASKKNTPAKNIPLKKPAVKRGRIAADLEPEEEEDEENYYEVEEEAPSPAKKDRSGKATGSKGKAAQTPSKRMERKEPAQSSPFSEARTPRSASRSARKSLKEMSDDEESEEEYVAQPTSSRGGKKR